MRRSIIYSPVLAIAAIAVFAACAAAQRPGGPGPNRVGPDGARGPRGQRQFMRAMPVIAALDADQDGEISATEISNAAAALQSLDKDNSGSLTADELQPEFRGGPGGPASGGRGGFGRRTANPEQVVERWMALDDNGDGQLDQGDLSNRFQGLVARADADDDGVATKEELTALAERESGRGFGGGQGFGNRGPGTDGSEGAPGGIRGPQGGVGGPRGLGGRPNANQFVANAMEFDADDDGKLDKEELAKFADQFGRGRGFRGGAGNREVRPGGRGRGRSAP